MNRSSNDKGKRIFDLLMALVLLVLMAPMFIAVSVLILVLDGRPVIFRQPRVGKDRVLFEALKFRTVDDEGNVTRVGKFIRPNSVDECMNLLNVVKGEMSLIGPRPWTLDDVERIEAIDPEYIEQRYFVQPGWTGPAQLCRAGTSNPKECRRLDLDFIHNWSLRRHAALLSKFPRLAFKRNYAVQGGRLNTWGYPIYCGSKEVLNRNLEQDLEGDDVLTVTGEHR